MKMVSLKIDERLHQETVEKHGNFSQAVRDALKRFNKEDNWYLAVWIDSVPGERPDVVETFGSETDLLMFVHKRKLGELGIYKYWENK